MSTPPRTLFCLALVALSSCTVSTGVPDVSTDASLKTKGVMSPLTLTVVGATATTLDVEVCAGPTGAQAGLSIHWIDASVYDQLGWSDADLCRASLSGQARDSRFDLAPGACTVVSLGRLFDEEPGVSFTCDELTCDTDYAVRAFAHANSTLNRSPWSTTVFGTTLACDGGDDGCTLTQGFWKTHPEAWPVDALTLGWVPYTAEELLAILWTPAQGNGLLTLGHQLIAARLNLASGASGTAVADELDAADEAIGALVLPPIGTGTVHASTTSALVDALADFNEGAVGPGHCDE